MVVVCCGGGGGGGGGVVGDLILDSGSFFDVVCYRYPLLLLGSGHWLLLQLLQSLVVEIINHNHTSI